MAKKKRGENISFPDWVRKNNSFYKLFKDYQIYSANSINMQNMNLTTFPKSIREYKGVLDLSYNNIKELPKNIEQNCHLILNRNKIKSIPSCWKMKSTLEIQHNKIEEIPKIKQSGCDLKLSHNLITSLDDLTEMTGALHLNFNKIKSLPNNFLQKYMLYLDGNLIQEIPKGYYQGNSLYLAHNKLTEIPRNYQYEGRLDVSFNLIQYIHDTIQEETGEREVFLEGNPINKIHENHQLNQSTIDYLLEDINILRNIMQRQKEENFLKNC